MEPQEVTVGRSQILEIVENAAQVAVNFYNLKIWGLDIVGGTMSPVVRVFVDTPWEGKIVPFVMPETRSQKSKKRAIHPKELEAKKDIFTSEESDDESILSESMDDDLGDESFDSENLNNESVSIAQCAHISRMIGITLEVEDTFADAWVLEVSSPGLERGFYHLRQLASYLEHPVEILLEDAHLDYENRRKFRGTLKSVEDSSFTLILDAPLDTPCTFEWDAVKKAHLIHIFPDTTLSKA